MNTFSKTAANASSGTEAALPLLITAFIALNRPTHPTAA